MRRKDKKDNSVSVETSQAWEKFVDFLKEKGDRITCARQIVFERVMERHDHFRADDLAAELAKGQGRVSRGTVYRTLALMEEGGYVCTVRDGGTHRHYEHTYGHTQHDHLICKKCGKFFEFEDGELDRILEKNCRKKGFTPTNRKVVVFGLCSECAKGGS